MRTLALIFFFYAATAHAGCLVLTSQMTPAAPAHDALGRLLAADGPCPAEVFSFREALLARGLELTTTLVGNRGFHNPGAGSFSLFELVTGPVSGEPALSPGDFFFGHFTALDDSGQLIADQNPEKGSLMIEAFAWDSRKGYYNFYELRGDGARGQWFYRGDSADIQADNRLLHRQPDPAHPKFGQTLRCAACHSAGGPIMKELAAPHNDWWQSERPLPLGGHQPDARLMPLLARVVSAERLAAAVRSGLEKLEASTGFAAVRKGLSLQERLRPLFCPVEVNFKSDPAPLDAGLETVSVPAAFFVDPRLLPPGAPAQLSVSRKDYLAALEAVGSHFSETDLPDADHAWLTPVKAESDTLAAEALINEGVIDRELATAVVAVDLTNPVVSPARCSLLKLVPNEDGAGWQQRLRAALAASPLPAAHELLANLTDPARDTGFQHERAAALLGACQTRLSEPGSVRKLVALLAQRRAEIAASEISKNPRGQILEPGFRLIFPETAWRPVPAQLHLGEDCLPL